MTKFTVVNDLNKVAVYYERIDELLTARMHSLYSRLKKEDCNHVVLLDSIFVGAFNISNWACPDKYLRVNWLAVTLESEENKYHVGTEILQFIIKTAISEEYSYILISVNSMNNRAIKLYEKNGFKEFKKVGSEIDMKLQVSNIHPPLTIVAE